MWMVLTVGGASEPECVSHYRLEFYAPRVTGRGLLTHHLDPTEYTETCV